MEAKTHKLTLGNHSEKVTKSELEGVKKALGVRFAEYEVTELQVPKPADVAAAKQEKPEKPEKPTPTT